MKRSKIEPSDIVPASRKPRFLSMAEVTAVKQLREYVTSLIQAGERELIPNEMPGVRASKEYRLAQHRAWLAVLDKMFSKCQRGGEDG